ncbi:hypothetical protein [Paraglaciecola sp.]|uniref:hypothetical protein n=1 Tax=Paraglaciecola sp. TaxID=1920173 RepID=UPI00273E3788|nr:hypothetical protein [Paraglaciecola sp.]MDP5029550.1 hypothetical protein [Paraglaciecola sp.]
MLSFPTHIRLADKQLSRVERQDTIDYLAEHPKAGDLMEGTGGVICQRRKSNLTKSERNELSGLIDLLVDVWRRKKS